MMSYQVACFGEVLWDILPDRSLPGGAPMNVAYHLQRLSIPTAMISSVGNDEKGEALLEVMAQYGLTRDFIQQDPTYETGKVYARVSPVDPLEMKYEIVKPVAWDYISDIPPLQALMRQSGNNYLVFGSLAARNEVSRNTLLSLLEGDRTLVFDVNLRHPYYSKELITELMHHCHILKINEEELTHISSWHQWPDNMEERAKALSVSYSIPTIIITRGAKGAALLKDGTFYRHPGYKVTVADTIGSGDAFLAGFLYSTIKGSKPEECLSFAAALGALIASYHGGCPDYDPAEISALLTNQRA
ncbi:carbohydrate kinase family protein [Chitinophaga tropicalis]|uniref:Carbohydrate kinase n=1 Tax=Chitinophaga tropicalis TaxID=2683588 RepID=A0A7K1TXY1_9BACT|nr:carbohydrate kinase [Chitinophaga tropicalis]MVT06964.1 carbohydrate kinase [Chitinophaga tropicalis]